MPSPMTGADIVRAFHHAMQARDWQRAATFLAPDVVIEWPATCERLEGERFLAMQRDYPEGWEITVLEVAGDARVASRVRVDQGDVSYLCAGFYDVDGGFITRGVEHWVTVGGDPAPAWREGYAKRLKPSELGLALAPR
ncbi:MAG: nuclear transport factor 2 family protein [Myxococcales bacterium]|nr:nuclear transport factor 2 family protein [Myxococcales bacterium]MCB9732518.1 nuclear transport factor 2 family protein [Deltaproteobacteria bacterium]